MPTFQCIYELLIYHNLVATITTALTLRGEYGIEGHDSCGHRKGDNKSSYHIR